MTSKCFALSGRIELPSAKLGKAVRGVISGTGGGRVDE